MTHDKDHVSETVVHRDYHDQVVSELKSRAESAERRVHVLREQNEVLLERAKGAERKITEMQQDDYGKNLCLISKGDVERHLSDLKRRERVLRAKLSHLIVCRNKLSALMDDPDRSTGEIQAAVNAIEYAYKEAEKILKEAR